ncbi:ArsC family reductase [Thalassotalea sp. LPB0316]|uniref:ArsC family reductase n=1 Tax=Thalassotalea sp. LPB0316 TaxID=2769490 RepID=UPI0018662DA1|nr:ArsC family reductase [Thalassotalea sp. LPB0316]QOL25173.1 ArsC family reductase [Thalassotalea sp. LPB0316]
MNTIYGISNCDTVKKALKFLDKHQINYSFHDFRKDGIDADLVNSFLAQVDWSELINKRSTTYRNLADDIKESLSAATIVELLIEQPTLIKRPVLVTQNEITIGFKEPTYKQVFAL